MPLYFFDILKNDDLQVDHEGQEFADEYVAHRQAVLAAAEIAAEEIRRESKFALTVSVADQGHQILFRTRVLFEPGDDERSSAR
jgi:hypothetical protein